MTAGRAGDGPGPVRTVFLGSGAFGRASLRRLTERDDVEVVVVVTAPPRPAGRGGRPAPTEIAELATTLGLSIETPTRLRDPAALERILALDPELIVLADYGQIVPERVARPSVRRPEPPPVAPAAPSGCDAGRGGHRSPAMRRPGSRSCAWMRAWTRARSWPRCGSRSTGNETTPSLEADLEVVAADLLDDRLGPWLRGGVTARPQSEAGATLTRPFRREDGRLDVARSAVELERLVRAWQPWPGTFVDTPIGRLVVWSAGTDATDGPPRGEFDAHGVGVGLGERLRLLEVQPGGGRRMTWDAFVRGRPAIVGASVAAGPGPEVR